MPALPVLNARRMGVPVQHNIAVLGLRRPQQRPHVAAFYPVQVPVGAEQAVSAQLHHPHGGPVAAPVAVAPHRVKGHLRVNRAKILPLLGPVAEENHRRRFPVLFQQPFGRGKRPVAVGAYNDLHRGGNHLPF